VTTKQIYGDAEATLEYLERCQPINDNWRVYIRARAKEVEAWIADLRRFASLKPGSRVNVAVNRKADALQSRLDKVLQ
jgi:hypothetical protein